jgi:transcription antitermination factor NusG
MGRTKEKPYPKWTIDGNGCLGCGSVRQRLGPSAGQPSGFLVCPLRYPPKKAIGPGPVVRPPQEKGKISVMPILAEQPCLYPEYLLVDPTAIELEGPPSERNWWVIYTKSRQEKSLARDLLGYRIPFYLPQIPRDHLARGRRVRTHVPVFPGYVFLFGSPDERVGALRTNRTSRILPVSAQDELLRDLRQLANLISLGAPLSVEQRLSPGRLVRIRRGSLAGFEGTVFQRRGSNRLMVAINFLQQGVSIEINDFMVEPI